MEEAELMWNNLLLLGFDAAALERRYRLTAAHAPSASLPHRGTVLNKDMFNKPNAKCMQIVLHFLFDIIDSDECRKRFAHSWPVNDAAQAREFNAVALKWLHTLEPHFVLRSAAGIKKSHVEVASGPRVISLLWTFSTHALEHVMKRDYTHAQQHANPTDYPPRLALSDRASIKLIPHAIHAAQLHTVRQARAFVAHTERAVDTQRVWNEYANQLMDERKQLQAEIAAFNAERSAFDTRIKPLHPDWFDDAAQVGAACTLRSQKVHTITRAYALLSKYYQKSTDGRALIAALVDEKLVRPRIDGAALKQILNVDSQNTDPLDLNELVRRWTVCIAEIDKTLTAQFNPSETDLKFNLDTIAKAQQAAAQAQAQAQAQAEQLQAQPISQAPAALATSAASFVGEFTGIAAHVSSKLAANEAQSTGLTALNSTLTSTVSQLETSNTDLRALIKQLSADAAYQASASPVRERMQLKLIPPTPATKYEHFMSQPTPARPLSTPLRAGQQQQAAAAAAAAAAYQQREVDRITRSVARRVVPAAPIASALPLSPIPFGDLNSAAASGSPLRFDDAAIEAAAAADPAAESDKRQSLSAVPSLLSAQPQAQSQLKSQTQSAQRPVSASGARPVSQNFSTNRPSTAAAAAAAAAAGAASKSVSRGGARPVVAVHNNFTASNSAAAAAAAAATKPRAAGAGGSAAGMMTATTIRVPKATATASAAATPKVQQKLQFSPINEESARRPTPITQTTIRVVPPPQTATATGAGSGVRYSATELVDAAPAAPTAYPPLQHTPIKAAPQQPVEASATPSYQRNGGAAAASPGLLQSVSTLGGGLTLSPTSLTDD